MSFDENAWHVFHAVPGEIRRQRVASLMQSADSAASARVNWRNHRLNPKSNTPESIIRLTGEVTSIMYLT